MKLLIIEDEREMLAALKKGFLKKGYAVDIADDGDEGSYLAEMNEYDAIILDLNLPGKDGLEILEEIRKRSNEQNVIILSARSTVPDKILGLDLGANDYLAKPFDFLELEARVRSLSRRDFIQHDTIIEINNLVLNTAKKSVQFNQNSIDFSPKEYSIFEYLAINKEKVISVEELIEHVWDSEVDLFTVSIKVHISNIRKKLFAVGKANMIKTVRGSGYTLESEAIQNKT